jgi:hypothetical protein
MFRRLGFYRRRYDHSERRVISTILHGVSLEDESSHRCENLKCVYFDMNAFSFIIVAIYI